MSTHITVSTFAEQPSNYGAAAAGVRLPKSTDLLRATSTTSSINAAAAADSNNLCCWLVDLVKAVVQRMSRTAQNSQGKSLDILTQLSNLLPTGTFLLFQALATLSTNDGRCGHTDKVVTGVIIGVLSVICAFSCFTDSYKAPTGVVYYGVVTTQGLWNPFFVGSGLPDVTGPFYTGGNGKYNLRFYDFVNASLSVMAFLVLSLLTAPVKTCYYPHIRSAVVKSLPLLVGAIIMILSPYAPPARNGFGHAIPESATTLASSSATTSLLRSSSTTSST
ncbi:unnamed protein product [Sphagnum compactum]